MCENAQNHAKFSKNAKSCKKKAKKNENRVKNKKKLHNCGKLAHTAAAANFFHLCNLWTVYNGKYGIDIFKSE